MGWGSLKLSFIVPGDYIVLASEPVCIVGVDVAAPGQIRRRKDGQFSLEETFHSFRDQFTQIEWQSIRELETEKAQEEAFRRNWSCKVANSIQFSSVQFNSIQFGWSWANSQLN